MQEENNSRRIDREREALFDEYTPLVYKLSNRMNYGYVEKEDLVQAGLMGLYMATIKYDFTKNDNFISYASIYIINEMKKELRENKLIIMNKNLCRLIKQLDTADNNASIDDLANQYGTTRENIFLALQYKNRIVSLNKQEEDFELINTVEDNQNNNYWLLSAMNNLSSMEREVVSSKYFYGFSQQEISKRFNKSQSFVSRVEKRALSKLRTLLKY